MTPEQTLAFVMFAIVAAITPGPSNVMLTAAGAVAGMLRGLPCLLGVSAGMAAMMFVVALGLGALVLSQPLLLAGLKWCGAALLLWLSWKIATAPPGDSASPGAAVGFGGAFAFQWLNPKSWLVSLSAAGTYLRPEASALAQALWIAGLFCLVALASGFVWLGFGVLVRQALRSARVHRAFNVAMGALLALSVLFVLV